MDFLWTLCNLIYKPSLTRRHCSRSCTCKLGSIQWSAVAAKIFLRHYYFFNGSEMWRRCRHNSVLHITKTLTLTVQSPPWCQNNSTIVRNIWSILMLICFFVLFFHKSSSMIDGSICHILLGFVDFSVE